jgi:hypothetical protein
LSGNSHIAVEIEGRQSSPDRKIGLQLEKDTEGRSIRGSIISLGKRIAGWASILKCCRQCDSIIVFH